MQTRRITPNSDKISTGLGELFSSLPLLFAFARRDIKIKYAQTYMGIFWSVFQPISALVIVSLFFGKLIHLDSGETPYPVFSFCGMLGWFYFVYLAGHSGLSLVTQQDIVRKASFPKIVLPFSKAISGLLDYGIWFVILIILLIVYGFEFKFRMFLFPAFFMINIIAGLAVGIWVAALSVRYRDLYQIVPYLIGMSIFVTPVVYPVETVSGWMRYVLYLNPMSGVLEGYRWTLLGTQIPSSNFLLGFGLLLILFITGLIFFKRTENKIADLI
ncbi:MAG: ABC transporter permease [Bacteroidetes bacterium]|nr:ABC transporter permease [Bacteroidota bacterium]MBU1718276.1 ABC transporter permease [Bacteroidota bacterium]